MEIPFNNSDRFCVVMCVFCLFCIGILDPLLYAEPFVPLEPIPHSEYNFCMDSSEGLADLFCLI